MQNTNHALVKIEVKGPIAFLTLDNPPLNILTERLLDELEKAVDSNLNKQGLRAIVLNAAGQKAFAAGADISQFPHLDEHSGIVLVEKGKKIFDKLAGSEKPVICAIQGMALGAGLELALACDIRIAEEDAKLGLPDTGLGILPGYAGTQRLPRLVGPGKAKEMILTGVLLTGREAYEKGLVERVVLKGQALDAAIEMAEKIAAKGPLAIAKAKKAVDEGLEMPLAAGQDLETQLFSELAETADMQEGVKAFTEKRKANFSGA